MGYSFSKLRYENLNEKLETDKKYYEGIIKKIETHNNSLLTEMEELKQAHKKAIKEIDTELRKKYKDSITTLNVEKESLSNKLEESIQSDEEHKNTIKSLENIIKECEDYIAKSRIRIEKLQDCFSKTIENLETDEFVESVLKENNRWYQLDTHEVSNYKTAIKSVVTYMKTEHEDLFTM